MRGINKRTGNHFFASAVPAVEFEIRIFLVYGQIQSRVRQRQNVVFHSERSSVFSRKIGILDLIVNLITYGTYNNFQSYQIAFGSPVYVRIIYSSAVYRVDLVKNGYAAHLKRFYFVTLLGNNRDTVIAVKG